MQCATRGERVSTLTHTCRPFGGPPVRYQTPAFLNFTRAETSPQPPHFLCPRSATAAPEPHASRNSRHHSTQPTRTCRTSPTQRRNITDATNELTATQRHQLTQPTNSRPKSSLRSSKRPSTTHTLRSGRLPKLAPLQVHKRGDQRSTQPDTTGTQHDAHKLNSTRRKATQPEHNKRNAGTQDLTHNQSQPVLCDSEVVVLAV